MQQKVYRWLYDGKIHRQDKVLYSIVRWATKGRFINRRKIKIIRNFDTDELNGDNFMCIVNHPSPNDFVYACHVINKRYMRGYLSMEYMYRRIEGSLLRRVGVFPKKTQARDPYGLKMLLRLFQQKNVGFMMFPEGLNGESGRNNPINSDIGKLVKRLGVDLLCCKLNGIYLAIPRFDRNNPRWGSGEAILDRLLTKQQIAQMTAEQIQQKIVEAITFDDFEWNKQARVKFKSKLGLANNLHKMLYRCPKCDSQFANLASGMEMVCQQCGNGVVLNDYYDMSPKKDGDVILPSIAHWYHWQYDKLAQDINNDPNFHLSSPCQLQMMDKCKRRIQPCVNVGEGIVRLDKEGLHYTGTIRQQQKTLLIPIDVLYTIVYNCGVSMEFTFEDEFYRFMLPNPIEVVKWAQAGRKLHDIYSDNKW